MQYYYPINVEGATAPFHLAVFKDI